MDNVKLEQYKRRSEEVQRNLNGGNIDQAMRLMLEMQTESFEFFSDLVEYIKHYHDKIEKKISPITKIYNYLGTTGTIILSLGMMAGAISGILALIKVSL